MFSHVLGAQVSNIHFIKLSDVIDEVGIEFKDCPICDGGIAAIYSGFCDRCKSWSIEFREKNTCPGCYNRGKRIGSEKCKLRNCHKGDQIDFYETDKHFDRYIRNSYNKNDFVFTSI